MTFSQKLAVFNANPQALISMGRGIEREGLRITEDGYLSNQHHPIELGSALTHKWITTDFSEQLLEFITPVSQNSAQTLEQLRDIHRFTYQALGSESIWPFSMPCYVKNEEDIKLANYGTSNTGKLKTLYRQGLKNRYGSMMQIISGVHFNFSFSDEFWLQLFGTLSDEKLEKAKSDAYFGLIRNYYRFGWMIPYLFGASPALCSSFIKKQTDIEFELIGESTYYLPYSTSLRLSDLGYTNSAQSGLKIDFNSLELYLEGVRAAIHTPSEDFAKIGVKTSSGYQQLNANVLQIENELYAPIRPKRVTKNDETPSQALKRAGVEYIEVRALDVNPFDPVGIDQLQIDFLDVFLNWCVLSESEPMTDADLVCWKSNWNKIILEGRKPQLELKIGCNGERLTREQWGKRVFAQLLDIAQIMDTALETPRYVESCKELETWFDEPNKTFSARFLSEIKTQNSIGKTGILFAKKHKESFKDQAYKEFSKQDFVDQSQTSLSKQQDIEAQDELSFDEYLSKYLENSLKEN